MLRLRGNVKMVRWNVVGWWGTVEWRVLGMVRRWVLLLVEVRMPLGREGSVGEIWRRNELTLGQGLHHLLRFRVSLLEKTRVKRK